MHFSKNSATIAGMHMSYGCGKPFHFNFLRRRFLGSTMFTQALQAAAAATIRKNIDSNLSARQPHSLTQLLPSCLRSIKRLRHYPAIAVRNQAIALGRELPWMHTCGKTTQAYLREVYLQQVVVCQPTTQVP